MLITMGHDHSGVKPWPGCPVSGNWRTHLHRQWVPAGVHKRFAETPTPARARDEIAIVSKGL